MLDLIWLAKFKDGTLIQQYDEIETQQKEHAFKEVLDRHDDLEHFALVNIHNGFIYSVNLLSGTLSITDSESEVVPQPDEDMLRGDSHKYRLIYFRRVTRTFGLSLNEIGNAEIVYFLGFQFNLKDGSNQKRLMKIDKDGKVIID